MKLNGLITFIFLLPSIFLYSQENVDAYVKKDFLIIQSTKSYKTAMTTARIASASTGISLQLRGLTENKSSGLSFSKEECEKEEIEYPAYYARGRWDDGVYISIEYSDAYSEFAKGYYIVIAASGSKEEVEIKKSFKKIKPKYKDAYFKSSKVYSGCMH